MTNFQAEYNALIRTVQEHHEAVLVRLTQLQDVYKQVMGKDDPSITDRVTTVTSAYNSKISKLEEQSKHFACVMNLLSDNQLRIAHSNERVNLDDDSVYSVHEAIRARIRERTLTESEYFEAIFPSEKTKPSADITTLMPKLAEPKIVTVYDVLSDKNDTSAFVESIDTAITSIKRYVGALYDLRALTRDELYALNNGLNEYMTATSPFRIEQMIDFAIPHFSTGRWNRLTESEKNTLIYTKKRDGERISGEFNRIAPDREDRVARIILKLYDRMVDENSSFRTLSEKSLKSISNAFNASAVFYVEKFLVEKVRAQRDPLYARTIYQNLEGVLQFHKKIKGILTPSDIGFLRVDYNVRKIRDLNGWLKKHGSLTPKQRIFAKNLMTQYVAQVQTSPVWTQEKVRSLSLAAIQ